MSLLSLPQPLPPQPQRGLQKLTANQASWLGQRVGGTLPGPAVTTLHFLVMT